MCPAGGPQATGEQAFRVQQKQADLAQFEQLQQEYPARRYQAMIEKTAGEIGALRERQDHFALEKNKKRRLGKSRRFCLPGTGTFLTNRNI